MYHVDLSMPQHTRFGKILFNFWYLNSSLEELAPNISGYPHAGGEHRLSIRHNNKAELIAFIDIMKAEYPEGGEEFTLVLNALNNDDKIISLKRLCDKRMPFLLWRSLNNEVFINPDVTNGECELSDLLKTTFKAYKHFSMYSKDGKSFREYSKKFYAEI